MKVLKQKILFLLYFCQSYGVLKNSINEKDYLSYNFLYRCLPGFKQASIRKAALMLTKEGDLDRISRNRQVYFRLTINGVKRIKILFPEFFCQNSQKRGWFTAVLKEKKADRETRNKLRKLGFARIIRGVYLLPATRDFQAKLEPLFNQTLLTFTPKLEFTDEKKLVGSLWPVDRQWREVSAFVSRTKSLLTKTSRQKKLSKQEIKGISALSNKFFIIIKNTIGLPKNLLPADWPLASACQFFSRLLQALR